MRKEESEEHIERCKELLEKNSMPAYIKEVARHSIRYHRDLIEIEKGGKHGA